LKVLFKKKKENISYLLRLGFFARPFGKDIANVAGISI